jgi:hypothetical protein
VNCPVFVAREVFGSLDPWTRGFGWTGHALTRRAIANFWRKLVRRFACHRSTFSRVGASDKPGALQLFRTYGSVRGRDASRVPTAT